MAQTKRPAAKKPASTKTVGKKAPAPKGATATPKDAPTAAEHFRRSCAARQKHAGVIARMDETTFKPHVGKSFTLTDRRGGEIKATLTRITVPKETPAGAIRHPFSVFFSVPKGRMRHVGDSYTLTAKGFDDVEIFVTPIGFDTQDPKKSAAVIYQAAFN
jgi:hypothetical protein